MIIWTTNGILKNVTAAKPLQVYARHRTAPQRRTAAAMYQSRSVFRHRAILMSRTGSNGEWQTTNMAALLNQDARRDIFFYNSQ